MENKQEDKKTQIVVSEKLLNASFAIIATVLVLLINVVLTFWYNNIFEAIAKIVIFGVSGCGVVWNYLKQDKKFTPEFWMSVGSLVLALRFV